VEAEERPRGCKVVSTIQPSFKENIFVKNTLSKVQESIELLCSSEKEYRAWSTRRVKYRN
jgi:hypothetical protein